MGSTSCCFLIDNDEEDQEIFGMALQEANPSISCIFASNGTSALQKLQSDLSFIPSMIFIDMNMPLMDGRQCLSEIKKLPHLKEVPVYIYSTTADPATKNEVRLLGAVDFIEKPPSYKDLTALLQRLFQSVDIVSAG
jgi:CheY-like chemotaxis protein